MDSPLRQFYFHFVCDSLWHVSFYSCQLGIIAYLCAPIRAFACPGYAPYDGTNRDVHARFVYLDSDSSAPKELRIASIDADIGLLSFWFLHRFNDVDDQFSASFAHARPHHRLAIAVCRASHRRRIAGFRHRLRGALRLTDAGW